MVEMSGLIEVVALTFGIVLDGKLRSDGDQL